MANQDGWWRITATGRNHPEIELSDSDKEHIAELIKEGYPSGEIAKDD